MTKKQKAALVKLKLLGGVSEAVLGALERQYRNYKPICLGHTLWHRSDQYREARRLGLIRFSVVLPNCKKINHDDGDPCYQTRLTGLGRLYLKTLT